MLRIFVDSAKKTVSAAQETVSSLGEYFPDVSQYFPDISFKGGYERVIKQVSGCRLSPMGYLVIASFMIDMALAAPVATETLERVGVPRSNTESLATESPANDTSGGSSTSVWLKPQEPWVTAVTLLGTMSIFSLVAVGYMASLSKEGNYEELKTKDKRQKTRRLLITLICQQSLKLSTITEIKE